MPYTATAGRYETMSYRRCGRSGIRLPAISLGLWHNFGGVDTLEDSRAMLLRAFDLGITHIDIANNYGPPAGSAELTFARVLAEDLKPYRDELFVSTKAGYYMWPGPYGDFGSRKYLVASIDQSLKRTGLDYFDLLYHHRPDPQTPVGETAAALDFIVRSGRALYVGISSYDAEQSARIVALLRESGTPCLIHQPSYSILNRWIEGDLLDVLERDGVGCIPFCPLAQGLLTDRYLDGIPADSRAAKAHGFLDVKSITEDLLAKLRKLNAIAHERGQTLAQMSLAWVLRDERVTSALIGASKVEQVEQNVAALSNLSFTAEELAQIDAAVA